MPRIVSAPMDLVIATHRRIDVRFAGINLTEALPPSRYVPAGSAGSAGMELNLHAVTSDETRRLDSQFYTALETWGANAEKPGADRSLPAPQMPANAVFEPIKANITDDAGTAYTLVAGRVAGTGTDWDATWIYSPAPPEQAKQLVLEFTDSGTPTGHRCVIDLEANDDHGS